MKHLLGTLGLSILVGCGLLSTRPKEEMAMAQVAFMAAKDSGGHRYAPGVFRKAEVYYLKAKSSYRKKYFNNAKRYAIISKKYSEMAEIIAVKRKFLEDQ